MSSNFILVRYQLSCCCSPENVTLMKFLRQFGPRRGGQMTCERHGTVRVDEVEIIRDLDQREASRLTALTPPQRAAARAAYELSQGRR